MYVEIGRVTKDIEVKDAGSTKVANFSIAVPRRFKRDGAPDTDFVNCTVFGKQAEVMAKHVTKGQMIYISGRLENDPYTDKEGKKRDNWTIKVEDFKFAGSKASGDADVPADIPADRGDEIPFA